MHLATVGKLNLSSDKKKIEYVLAKVTQHPLIPSFLCQRSLKMADKTTTRTRIWHSRLDSFIMHVKKDVRRLLTDRWTCLQVKPLG